MIKCSDCGAAGPVFFCLGGCGIMLCGGCASVTEQTTGKCDKCRANPRNASSRRGKSKKDEEE